MTHLSQNRLNLLLIGLMLGGLIFLIAAKSDDIGEQWPEPSRETKPWTRWWWPGSAVTKAGITAELESFKKAGIGGVEITPIYGVVGYEDKFVNFLSPTWIELLLHTLREGERLGLGVDMATGTGWPFGGPWVTQADACKTIHYKTYTLKGGAQLTEKIIFIQKPFLKAIGNPVFMNPGGDEMRLNPKDISIAQLNDPIAKNKNLQALALEQVAFEKRLKLAKLMAYGDSEKIVDITAHVSKDGTLQWTAPAGNWKLYAVFEGFHGKMVERAGPGGEGDVIDHFSKQAVENYLSHFDSAFSTNDIHLLRSFFNDSYEVDDAKGVASWTPELFEEFKHLRGYDLAEHLPELFSNAPVNRVLCDYRETISQLLLDNFTKQWKTWAHKKKALVRNQAHGSPANILDLYALVDIPEIEGVEPLRIKMASSAANVTGKKLVSSESATWLDEHFQSTLGDVKVAVDRFMLNGVNHIFYHGTCYSPRDEPWPGWLFYAAVHFNSRNPMWSDFGKLNQYITRSQSLLQNSTPDNDVLLYYPVYDGFSTHGKELLEHFDGIKKQFDKTPFERAANSLMRNGYEFDYISDKQLAELSTSNGKLITSGKNQYQTVIVPHCKYIPLETMKKLHQLGQQGATILITEGFPDSTAGFKNYKANEAHYKAIRDAVTQSALKEMKVSRFKTGDGYFIMADSVADMLQSVSIRKESCVKDGLSFIRKKNGNGNLYFIANTTEQPFTGNVVFQRRATTVVLYDPMSGQIGPAESKLIGDSTAVKLRLEPHQTLFVEMRSSKSNSRAFKFYSQDGAPLPLDKKWNIVFNSGGPTLPPATELQKLSSWTEFGNNDYPSFSGSATYSYQFEKPVAHASCWLLNLGKVHESAKVYVNGRFIDTVIASPYQLYLDSGLFKKNNLLEIVVTNSMANRIAYMDRNKLFWKKFYNINFPALKAEDRVNGLFDAVRWPPKESGLIGPVFLEPMKPSTF